jgi:hypothetical protein
VNAVADSAQLDVQDAKVAQLRAIGCGVSSKPELKIRAGMDGCYNSSAIPPIPFSSAGNSRPGAALASPT